VKALLKNHADINKCNRSSESPDATNNGDRPCLLGKLISAPELSKHLTIAQCPCCDATNNGDRPSMLRKLISAPELTNSEDILLLLNVYLVLVQISICLMKVDNHRCL
jgi:hypothetical protein